MRIFLQLVFLLFTQFTFAQQLKGKVVSDSAAVNDVLVINVDSQERTYTGFFGQFTINANIGQEIRFVKEGYERRNLIIKNREELLINIPKLATEIEEVRVKKKLTGDLAKDSKMFDESRKKVVLNSDIRKYFKTPSSTKLLKPKQGEFVQLVGQGFSIGKIDDRWEITDFVIWIRKNFTDDYFLSMGLKADEIDVFIYYSLRTFETRNILKYGFCGENDAGNLKLQFEKMIGKFKKN